MALASINGLSEKELARTFEFIEKAGELARPQKPIEVIAKEVMLSCFGWPADGLASAGYKRARTAIVTLEAQNKISCKWSPGKRLIAIRRKQEMSATEECPTKLSVKTPFVPPDDLTAADRRLAATRRILAQMKPWSPAAREADIIKRGNRNEDWAHTSLLKLLDILARKFSEIILYGWCKRSGKHDPTNGRVDLDDHHGQDFAFHLITKRRINGSLVKGYIIYDSKGNRQDVEVFNKHIIRHPGQSDALLKKAIWANAALSSRKDFVREVVSDCIGVSLLPETFDIEALLNFFED